MGFSSIADPDHASFAARAFLPTWDVMVLDFEYGPVTSV